MEIGTFAEIEQEFIQRAHAMVYCCCATVDTRQRPRSRVLHPIWEGATGWIATGRNSLKSRHLASNPFVSLAYIADPVRPVYVDCRARWEEDNPAYGVLRLSPWRICLADLLQAQDVKVWRGALGPTNSVAGSG